MSVGNVSLYPAGQTSADGITLAVQDLQSRVSFYQTTTLVAILAAAGLYFYPRMKDSKHVATLREHGKAARETLRSTRQAVGKRISGEDLATPRVYV